MSSSHQTLAPTRHTEVFSLVISLEQEESDPSAQPKLKLRGHTTEPLSPTDSERESSHALQEIFMNEVLSAFDRQLRGSHKKSWMLWKSSGFLLRGTSRDKVPEKKWTDWRTKVCDIAESIHEKHNASLHSTGWEVWTDKEWKDFQAASQQAKAAQWGSASDHIEMDAADTCSITFLDATAQRTPLGPRWVRLLMSFPRSTRQWLRIPLEWPLRLTLYLHLSPILQSRRSPNRGSEDSVNMRTMMASQSMRRTHINRWTLYEYSRLECVTYGFT
jgi:hypothetical protein